MKIKLSAIKSLDCNDTFIIIELANGNLIYGPRKQSNTKIVMIVNSDIIDDELVPCIELCVEIYE